MLLRRILVLLIFQVFEVDLLSLNLILISYGTSLEGVCLYTDCIEDYTYVTCKDV